MSSLGFGLERIGLLVLRAPMLVGLLLAVTFAVAAASVPKVSFDGRLIDILSENQAFQSYAEVKENFRDASQDIFLLVEAPTLFTAEGMEALRLFHIDLALVEPVEAVYSVFSLGELDFAEGRYRLALPPAFESDAQVAVELEALRNEQPAARALVLPDASAAIVVVTLMAPIDADNRLIASLTADVFAALDDIVPDGFTVTAGGIPSIQASVVESLRDDQWRMALFALLIGAVIGVVVFRSVIASLVCAAPAAVAVVWLLGLFNLLDIEINFLYAILPSLALILALVDSIVFFFHWQAANAEGGDPRSNLRDSILRIGPASAMTSITTALAFAALAYAQNPALQKLAGLGILSVAMAFISFITVLPTLCLLIVRFSGRAGRRRPSFAKFGGPIGRWAGRAATSRVIFAILVAVTLGVIHFQVGTNFQMERYFPPDATIVETEAELGNLFGGTVPLYAVVRVPEGETFYGTESRARVAAAVAVFDEIVGEGNTVSIADLWADVAPEDVDLIGETIATADANLLQRLLAIDRQAMLVTVQLPSLISSDDVSELIVQLREGLERAGLGDAVVLTGFPVLSAIEIPDLVEELRLGLLIAVGLAVIAIAVASRSLKLAAASLIPNLLPILVVEAVLWAMGLDHDLTSVVALTIAFGIGIDNAVHLINMYRINRGRFDKPENALSEAVRTVGPALMASTAIIGISYLATQTSEMPSIGLLGQLVIATLLAALIANLVFLPSFIALFDRVLGRSRDRKLVPESS
jgi:predicted RND superfamily exporter protein